MTCPTNAPCDCGLEVPTTLSVTITDSCYRSSDYTILFIDGVPHHWDAARDGWVGPDGSVFPAATLMSLVGAPVEGGLP